MISMITFTLHGTQKYLHNYYSTFPEEYVTARQQLFPQRAQDDIIVIVARWNNDDVISSPKDVKAHSKNYP